MKVEFTAIIHEIGAKEAMKKGFRQNNIFTIPEVWRRKAQRTILCSVDEED